MDMEFGILGPLQLLQAGKPRDLGSLRQRGLLARLIVHGGHRISTDRLLDDLWPDEAPDRARHTLHVYISRVRAVLGDERQRLESDAAGYRLHLEPDELDATRFEQAVADGRAARASAAMEETLARLTEALELWRGPALVEFSDEEFAVAEAARLDQLRLATLEERMAAELELGHHTRVAEELRSLTLEHPFREGFWEQLMTALYRSGRQSDALRVYGEARTRLADELGIEPGPSLKRMEQRVLGQDPTLDTPASFRPVSSSPSRPFDNLPLQRTTFVGRERDLAIAGELLQASRLLTLTGAPGSGKTRMALRLASEHASDFPDGIFYVSLAGTTDPGRILPAIASVLDAADAARGETDAGPSANDAAVLALRLRRLRCLLLLDDCEHLAGGFEEVGRLIDAAPSLTVLATSRAPLLLAGEQEFPVLPLQVPPAGADLDTASVASFDAVVLLVARARAADPTFAVTPENARALAGIAARLDGLPLALELAAGRLRLLRPQDLLARLEHRLPLLSSGASDAVDRHQTLRAAIAWSYELLDPSERHLFRHLATFVGAFTVAGAADVADLPEDEVLSGVESLLAKSLLTRPAETGEARFVMLQTLREFGVEELEAAGELTLAIERHAQHLLLVAEAIGPDLDGPGHEEAMRRLGREAEDIRAALRRCADGHDVDTGLRLASATWRYWQASGELAEARHRLDLMLAVPGATDAARANALDAAAGLAYWQADYRAAQADYEHALALYRAAGDRDHEADTLYGLSMTATWGGDPASGARLALEARTIFEELGLRSKVGETSMAQGFALWQERRYDDARPLWEDALAISREEGADTLAVTQLAGIAGLEFHMGAHADALRIALDALDEACDLENVALCVWLLDFVAAFAVRSEPAAAVRIAAAAEAQRRASGGGLTVQDLHITPAREAARRSLGRVACEAAWAEGREMDLEDAVSAARSLRLVSVG